jgi:predicted TPR repeat methyltransferase
VAGEAHAGHLGAVYGAGSPEAIAAAYDAWAAEYDAEMAARGYRHPSVCLGLLARHLPKGAGPILDAGAGTGLIGDWLPILGYPPATGVDISAGMLAVARAKGRYAVLVVAALGAPLPFADGAFAAVVSTGVFTTGHVGAEAFAELRRVTRAGGVWVMSVKESLWQGAVGAAVAAEGSGLSVIEATDPYISMPGEAGTSPSRAVVLTRA